MIIKELKHNHLLLGKTIKRNSSKQMQPKPDWSQMKAIYLIAKKLLQLISKKDKNLSKHKNKQMWKYKIWRRKIKWFLKYLVLLRCRAFKRKRRTIIQRKMHSINPMERYELVPRIKVQLLIRTIYTINKLS